MIQRWGSRISTTSEVTRWTPAISAGGGRSSGPPPGQSASAPDGSSCRPAPGRPPPTSTVAPRRSSTCLGGRGLSGTTGARRRSPPATASSTSRGAVRTRCSRSAARRPGVRPTRPRRGRPLPPPRPVAGRSAAPSRPAFEPVEGTPIQFVREAELGPPELPEPGPRPANIVNLSDTVADVRDGRLVRRTRRNLGRAAGSVTCGVQHVEVAPGGESSPAHCHSVEEEIFVILGGDGSLDPGRGRDPGHARPRRRPAAGDRRRAHVPGRRSRSRVPRVRHPRPGRPLLLSRGRTRSPSADRRRRADRASRLLGRRRLTAARRAAHRRPVRRRAPPDAVRVLWGPEPGHP